MEGSGNYDRGSCDLMWAWFWFLSEHYHGAPTAPDFLVSSVLSLLAATCASPPGDSRDLDFYSIYKEKAEHRKKAGGLRLSQSLSSLSVSLFYNYYVSFCQVVHCICYILSSRQICSSLGISVCFLNNTALLFWCFISQLFFAPTISMV